MKLKELLSLITRLAIQHKVAKPYIVGGTTREKVLGQLEKIDDLDITTGDGTIKVLAQAVSTALGKQYQIQTKEMKDGHTSIFMGDLKVDFSSNFRVPNIQSILQGMGIEKATSMQQELFSRDFTCNALLMDFDLKTISDPTHKGLQDIKDKVIRTCLTPEITLTSNKNRVIRAIYLAAKLDFEVDAAIIEWVRANPASVQNSSSHLLTEKLNSALEYNADKTVKLLDQMGLWSYIPVGEKLYPFYKQRIK